LSLERHSLELAAAEEPADGEDGALLQAKTSEERPKNAKETGERRGVIMVENPVDGGTDWFPTERAARGVGLPPRQARCRPIENGQLNLR
jgi:hypothetical protein